MTYILKYSYLFFILTFLSCINENKKNTDLHRKNPTGFYGNTYKPQVKYLISSLLNNSDHLLGKTVGSKEG